MDAAKAHSWPASVAGLPTVGVACTAMTRRSTAINSAIACAKAMLGRRFTLGHAWWWLGLLLTGLACQSLHRGRQPEQTPQTLWQLAAQSPQFPSATALIRWHALVDAGARTWWTPRLTAQLPPPLRQVAQLKRLELLVNPEQSRAIQGAWQAWLPLPGQGTWTVDGEWQAPRAQVWQALGEPEPAFIQQGFLSNDDANALGQPASALTLLGNANTLAPPAIPLQAAPVAAWLMERCRQDLVMHHDVRILANESGQVAEILRKTRPLPNLGDADATLAPWLRDGQATPLDHADYWRLCMHYIPDIQAISRQGAWQVHHPRRAQVAWLVPDNRQDSLVAQRRGREWQILLDHLGFSANDHRPVVILDISQQRVTWTAMGQAPTSWYPAIVGRPGRSATGDSYQTPVQIGPVSSQGLELFPNWTTYAACAWPGSQRCQGVCMVGHGPQNPLGSFKLAPSAMPIQRTRCAAHAQECRASPRAHTYIHATNQPSRFVRFSSGQRMLSHGCVRASPPLWQAVVASLGPQPRCQEFQNQRVLAVDQGMLRLSRALQASRDGRSTPQALSPCETSDWHATCSAGDRDLWLLWTYPGGGADGAGDGYHWDERAMAIWQADHAVTGVGPAETSADDAALIRALAEDEFDRHADAWPEP